MKKIKLFAENSIFEFMPELKKYTTGNTKHGCYRDKWRHDEELRILYSEIEIPENKKYIINSSNNHFGAKRGNLLLHKTGSLPSCANKTNILTLRPLKT